MIDEYHTQIPRIRGTDYKEVSKRARILYKEISSKTKRRPYIRSVFFKKEKIFLDYFWSHLQSKNWKDRLRRLKYYECALDLIMNTRTAPFIIKNRHNNSEVFYRFTGLTRNRERFFVQIKENTRRREKSFISVFPE